MSAIATLSSQRSTSSRRRPAKLEDREWLRQQLLTKGERQIAKDLGCARETVRSAIRSHQLEPAEIGRRRGLTLVVPDADPELSQDVLDVVPVFNVDRHRKTAASEQLIASRVVAVHHARNDPVAYEQALLELASAALLVRAHRRRVRFGRLP